MKVWGIDVSKDYIIAYNGNKFYKLKLGQRDKFNSLLNTGDVFSSDEEVSSGDVSSVSSPVTSEGGSEGVSSPGSSSVGLSKAFLKLLNGLGYLHNK